MGTSTRHKDEMYLLGRRDLESLSRLHQLPTQRQVLLRLLHYLNVKKNTRESAHLVIEEVLDVWNKAAVATRLPQHCVDKLEKLHSHWLLLKKNKSRNTKAQKDREELFRKSLDKLFDIAHVDALELIKIAEDKDFLIDQRGERKLFMSSEDKKLKQLLKRTQKRKKRSQELHQKEIERIASTSKKSNELSLNSSSSNCYTDLEQETEYKASIPIKPTSSVAVSIPKLPPINIFTSHVTSALDRNKVTDREAVRVIIPLAAALGHDPSSLSISRSTVRRERKKARIEISAEIKASFAAECPLVVHWDGKILPDLLQNKKVDRLPVLVSGNGNEKLLGVPKLSAGTGEEMSNAVLYFLKEWSVEEQVQAMSFDTTSSNTGHKKGACSLLEAKLGRELLWLACRHHMLEIILSKVFQLCFGPSSSPEIPLFKRYKVVWPNICHETYERLNLTKNTETLAHSTMATLKSVASGPKQIRDDYQELIELTMILLNDPPAEIHWRSPGAIHQARWMAKLLYCMKIFLFKKQSNVFKLTKREERQICRFVNFGALIYYKAWIEAPLTAEAPGSDLQLWKNLRSYELIDPEIGKAARTVLERHLWYLSDELVCFALFSDNVTCTEKFAIVEGMKVEPGPRSVRGIPALLSTETTLGVFASKRTKRTLSLLNISESFLQLSPESWIDNLDYCRGKKQIQLLRSVNDTAERGVKLFEDYNQLLTKDENEKQFILQVVENNRQRVPTETSKNDLIRVVLNKYMKYQDFYIVT